MSHWWDRIPKKLIVFVVGLGVQLLPIDSDTKHEITKAVGAFLLGQGIADFGKEKAKVEALSGNPLIDSRVRMTDAIDRMTASVESYGLPKGGVGGLGNVADAGRSMGEPPKR